MEPNPIIPAGVFARIEHQGQHLTVVKIQEAYPGDVAHLQQELSSALQLGPEAALLVLPIEGPPIISQGRAEQLYNDYLSTNTAAVAEQTWQPIWD
ncbi:hypothetical protein [Hymenobacter cellulosivorans]|uniref:Uncharacterized protein n=1 Tax=Hymenobacter cellulosivorans TaxID=2932249 RepID=A0ABY4F8B3_9BACT|nr:hypothetical protein [Hymenobacter cellulosivorans]UOQ52897.1 hypothetical protein MUN80_24535 [Hymenobacter cellulosivorans]